MRILAAILCIFCSVPAAQADPCRDRIAQLFFEGPLDPNGRPPYRLTSGTLKPDGSYEPGFEVIWLAVDQAMTIQNGMHILMRGERSWIANAPEGPWTLSPPSQPFDAVQRDIAQRRQMQDNLTDTSCDGMYTLEGRTVERFAYRTLVRDDSQGIWFGALYAAYVDPETGLLMRMEESESVAHYAPTPSPDLRIQMYAYDPSLTLPDPQ